MRAVWVACSAAVRAATWKVTDGVRGVLWYQGESDNDNAAVHVAGFTTLLDDWRAEMGSAGYFVFQVRTSPCNNTTTWRCGRRSGGWVTRSG